MEHKYKILYVDDEIVNLNVFKSNFRRKYKIFTVDSGKKGLEILEKEAIDLIITDQQMPEMSGSEFLEQVLVKYPDPIRLILTAYSNIEAIIDIINKCDVYRYITKPWTKEDMSIILEKALETYQLQQDNKGLVIELKELNQYLEHKVQLRTQRYLKANQELSIAKEKVEESSKAKELFLSTMSHEIRTPLNAIIGISHLLKKDKYSPEQEENLNILSYSANNLLVLINDILDLSKIEAGKIELDKVAFDLESNLKKLKKSFTYRCKERGIALNLNFDKNLKLEHYVIGDFTKINQILNNFLENAIKFTSKGSITVGVKKNKEDENGIEICFGVKDTGIGIEQEKIQSIFDLFSQANSSTSRKYGGTGLGLAISKRLVELLGGEIKLESELGKGSAFSFSLYFDKDTKKLSPTNQNQNSEIKNLAGQRILLVEDNRLNQHVAKKFLSSWNAKIDIAENGIIAIEKAKSKKYDIILMDLHMPKMDGYNATKQIRLLADDYFQKIPIIALSASAMSINNGQFEQMGINDFIRKPFNPIELYQILKKHLSEKIIQ